MVTMTFSKPTLCLFLLALAITGCPTDPGEDPPTCTPDCSGKVCGEDGCGGTCGSCLEGQSCYANHCARTCTRPLRLEVYRGFPTQAGPDWVFVRDFDKDGTLDVLTVNTAADSVNLLRGQGNGNFELFVASRYDRGLESGVVLADFNGDGRDDVAISQEMDNRVLVLLGGAGGTWGPPVHHDLGARPRGLAAGDFNRDGKIDLAAISTPSTGAVTVRLGQGDGTFGAASSFPVHGTPKLLTVGDFTNDGLIDLAVIAPDINPNGTVLVGDGAGGFQREDRFFCGDSPNAVTAGDWNRDGKLDLAVAQFLPSEALMILLGDGNGDFSSEVRSDVGGYPHAVISEDVNLDGRMDLVLPYSYGDAGTLSLLFGTDTGSFGPVISNEATYAPEGLAFGDLNGDGWPDAVTGNSTEVVVLFSTCN
jgi:hypothetical protein